MASELHPVNVTLSIPSISLLNCAYSSKDEMVVAASENTNSGELSLSAEGDSDSPPMLAVRPLM